MSLLQEHQPTFPPRLVSSPPRQAADWMGALPSHLRLDALTIPGTHDSGATRGGTWVTCQEMTIAEQLAAGVRHLDIRVRLHGGRFGVHHGRWHQGITLDDVLADCRAFLAEHPTETVLLSLKQEFRPRETVAVASEWARLRARCTDLLLDGRRTPQLGEARGRVVVVTRDPAFSGLEQSSWEVHDQWQVHSREFWTSSKWPAVTDHLRRARAGRGDRRMWSCHTTSTGWRLAPRPASELATEHLTRHFAELGPRPSGLQPERNGIVLLDFPPTDLLDTLWQRNL